MRRNTTIAGLLIAAGALTACGGQSVQTPEALSPATVTVQAASAPQVVTQTVEAAPTTTEDPVTTEDDTVDDSVKLPNLVGETLDVAEDDLDSMGVAYHEVGGGTFGIVVRSNWTVCATKPKAGKKVDFLSNVSLIVKRAC